MLYSELVLRSGTVFSFHLFCGTSYAHFFFPMFSPLQLSLPVLFTGSWSFSEPCQGIRGEEIVFCRAKRNQNNRIGYLERKIQTIVSTSAMLCHFHFLLMLVFSVQSSFLLEASAATSSICGNVLMSGNRLIVFLSHLSCNATWGSNALNCVLIYL